MTAAQTRPEPANVHGADPGRAARRDRRFNSLGDLLAGAVANPETGCWIWQRSQVRGGYGKTHFRGSTMLAHRAIWIASRGEIAPGLTLDHLCRNRLCVNPEHLEPVTIGENWRRATALITHCPHGHEYTPPNTYIDPRGKRHCRACNRERCREWRKRRG